MSILTAPQQAQRKKERQKKPDELLSSVVHETAIPAAVELLNTNEPFVFPSGTAWAILLLDAEDIGGLSKRHSRDEAKGSIIELIDKDSISTLATSDMLAEEVFGIIPTSGTLERMDEYGLLSNAEYAWAVVYRTGNDSVNVEVVADATFPQAQAIAAGQFSLRDAVGEDAWAKHSGQDIDAAAAEVDAAEAVVDEAELDAPASYTPARAALDDDGDPLFDDAFQVDIEFDDEHEFTSFDESETQSEVAVFDEEPDEAAQFDQSFDAFIEDERDEVAGDDIDVDGLDDVYEPQADLVDDSEPVADQSMIRNTLARRFLTEDLDLAVKLDEFDITFGVGALSVQIEVPDGSTSWLGDQIAQLTRQANAKLAKLHSDGETMLQTQFINLMSLHVEQVIKEVSLEREGSVYQNLNASAKAKYREELAAKDEKARQAQTEIAQAFEAAIKQAGQQAAIQAEAQYRERHKARTQREQVDAAAAIEAKIENDHAYTQQEILALRRTDADRKMAVGTTRIFEILAERQQENLAAERALMIELTNDIQRVIDENRKNDVSRAQALATEQATFDRVGALQAEHAGIVERMRNEAAERLRRTEEEFERQRLASIEQIKVRDAEWQHTVSLEKLQTQAQSDRVADLTEQMNQMGAAFKAQYDARVNDLKADREAYIHDLERTNQVSSRMHKVLTGLTVALSLLMLAAGFIIGALVM